MTTVMLAAQFFGRLHPVLVHLPIGILFLAAIFEVLSYFRKYRQLKQAVQPSLLIGAVSAVAAALSGYLLSQEGGYDDRLLTIHRNTGIATAVFACVLLFIRRSAITFFKDREKKKLIRIFLFIPLIALLSLAGHLGGSLTHGENYLLATSTEEVGAPSLKLTSTTNLDSIIFYSDVIEPILESRCYACHSSRKQKGQLRLDMPEYILKGGKHGSVLTGVVTDSAALYARLMLSLEEEKHMPPNEKPQLTSSEIALIRGWIAEGSLFDQQLGKYKETAKLKTYIHSLIDQSTLTSILPSREVQPAGHQALEALASKNILVLPIGSGTNYLSASFVNARSLGDADLSLLLPIKDQLLWLNLGRTKITDAGIDIANQLSNLKQLNLEYTSLHDSGVEKLKPLTMLSSLNLVGTSVSDSCLLNLKHLKSLRKVFLYQTKVTASGIRNLHTELPDVFADTGGYQLPSRVTDTLVFRYPKKK